MQAKEEAYRLFPLRDKLQHQIDAWNLYVRGHEMETVRVVDNELALQDALERVKASLLQAAHVSLWKIEAAEHLDTATGSSFADVLADMETLCESLKESSEGHNLEAAIELEASLAGIEKQLFSSTPQSLPAPSKP